MTRTPNPNSNTEVKGGGKSQGNTTPCDRTGVRDILSTDQGSILRRNRPKGSGGETHFPAGHLCLGIKTGASLVEKGRAKRIKTGTARQRKRKAA